MEMIGGRCTSVCYQNMGGLLTLHIYILFIGEGQCRMDNGKYMYYSITVVEVKLRFVLTKVIKFKINKGEVLDLRLICCTMYL